MRRIASTGSVDDTLLERVNYRNHAQHCGPPPTWCPNKAKCPLGFRSADALGLLKEGLRRSMFPPESGAVPSPVWAVDDCTKMVYEAKITNAATAEYHGYPLPDSDPLKPQIIRQWQQRG